MKIWLINKKVNKKGAYGNRRIMEELKKQGISHKFVAIEDIELVIDSEGKEKIFLNNKKVKLPDIALARNDTSYLIKSIVDFLEKKGVKVINPNNARFLAKDKFLSLQKLAINNIAVPKTILLKGTPNINFIEQELNYPIIIKKIEGSKGKGIMKINNKEDLEDTIEMLDDLHETYNKNIILQEYIGEKVGQDLRFFVVGGKVIGSMLRKGKTGDFKSNYSGGGEVFNHKATKQEKELAIKASKIIGLDIAGVDVLFEKNNGYKICEVNASPGFEGLEEATGKDIAKLIVNFIIKKYKITK